MSDQARDWSRKVDGIIRSRHYTWIGEGLGGEDVPEAMSRIMTDVVHICRREGISLDELIAECQRKANAEATGSGDAALN